MRLLTIVLLLLSNLLIAQSDIQITGLTCDYRTNPLGIESATPALSWKMLSQIPGQKQTANQILVASRPELLTETRADVWNSGMVNSAQSVAVKYQGKPLQSRQQYFWKVKVWDKDGKSSDYSPLAHWEMALLDDDDWQAKWIRHPDFMDDKLEAKPAPYFRKEFSVNKEVVSARAYVTGLGYFVMHLNGEKVSDHILDPVKTRYDKVVKYLVFDITDQLKLGENAVGMILGTGWYNHFADAAWQFSKAYWRSYPEMICQLEIEYTDGSKEIITSDNSWKASQGPIVFDGIRNGEYYDARLEMPGCDLPHFDDTQWKDAVEVKGPPGKMMAQQLPAIKEMKEIKPVSVSEVKPGVYMFDLGQNIAGYSRIKVAGPAGTEITMKHGERLHPDSTVEQKQILRFLRTGEAQTDKYTLKGEGVEVWNPQFVYHGYQYVEVSGLPVKPTLETLTGVVLYTSFESVGQFECSNPLFNRIQEITRWSYIGNYHGVPTDCPHREKIGWTGDGHLVAEAGLYNYNTITSYIKWLDDHVDEQRPDGNLPGVIPTSGWGYEHGRDEETRHLGYGPSWEGSMVLIPWYMYVYTGDTTMLSRYYEPIKKYISHLERNAKNYLLNFGIDDHKAYYTKTEGDIIASAYFYFLTNLTGKIAEVLHQPSDVGKYAQLATNIKKAFQKKYYNKKEKLIGNAGQTMLSSGIYMDLMPEKDKEQLLQNLLNKIDSADHHFDAGVGGVKALYEALASTGNDEIVYQMVNQTDFPSYGYWIEKGANTLWQDWDASMSLNHIMFGSVSEWFFQSLAGINPDVEQPGFKNILIRPQFIPELDWVSASYKGPYGKILSSWWREEENIVIKVKIPINSTGSLALPEGFILDDKNQGDKINIKLKSGDYQFKIRQIKKNN
ncbi:MAG: family 78 glycoside hydrolase catalytic domain [Cyclobacteriaceae bacterium]